jgi:hypothetical protein
MIEPTSKAETYPTTATVPQTQGDPPRPRANDAIPPTAPIKRKISITGTL